jgi:hypothetical protein
VAGCSFALEGEKWPEEGSFQFFEKTEKNLLTGGRKSALFAGFSE